MSDKGDPVIVKKTYRRQRDNTIRKVFCPECEKAKLRSKCVFKSGDAKGTSFAIDKFWGENGNFHYHDPRISMDSYECSNGHNFVLESRTKCWCGWVWEGDPPENEDTVATVENGKIDRKYHH